MGNKNKCKKKADICIGNNIIIREPGIYIQLKGGLKLLTEFKKGLYQNRR